MNASRLIVLALGLLALPGFAQTSGNIAYSQPYGRSRPEQAEREKRLSLPAEPSPGTNAMFLDASVLMNVLADEYVAVLAVSQEGDTPADCGQKMDGVIRQFIEALKPLGIATNDIFVDFIAQERIYSYHLQDNVAREQVAGFELKKNVSVHYQAKALIDRLIVAAASAKIYDLVKVDYIVRDPAPIQGRLLEEAAAVIKKKAADYERLFGVALAAAPQVYAHKPGTYFPSEMYDNYTAFEGERVDRPFYQSKYVIQDLRKNRTFYFNPLSPGGYDRVINPVIVEPVVQFTLYLKLRYDIDLKKSKRDGRP